MKFFFIYFTVFILCSSAVYAEGEDGKNALLKGKDALEKGNYKDAITSLSVAEKEFPLLGDYAIFWLSNAYHKFGEHQDALKTIRYFLTTYPNSPLIKKARLSELRESEEISEEKIQELYESYMKDYPSDEETRYRYAQWLKKNDKSDIAKSIFKDIYLEAGPFSAMAYTELSVSDITIGDMIKRASNLIRGFDYEGAETLLRYAQEKDDGKAKNEILEVLGLSLFRQKRYLEAAGIYKEASERYWEVRSLYRAKKHDVVYSFIDELFRSQDKRFLPILIAVASDKRKEGKIEEAIKIFENVIEKYPAECEDALWGLGWTYFLSGDYKKATDVFSRLYDMNKDTRYLYWKGRSIDADGTDALDIYRSLIENERNFYSILSYAKIKVSTEKSQTSEDKILIKEQRTGSEINLVKKKNDRVEALFDLNLTQEALSELIHISKDVNSLEELYYIFSTLEELRAYKQLVRLVEKTPYIEQFHQFRYPLAYKEIIDKLASQYNVDPLLVLAVIREESRYDPEIKSIAGAIGLMQLMPKTASRFDRHLQLGIKGVKDIYDIKKNLHIGIYYLSTLIKEFNSYACALAAYNAGEDIVRKWLQIGKYKNTDEFIDDIPYSETRRYVKRVITTFSEYKRLFPGADGVIEFSLEKL